MQVGSLKIKDENKEDVIKILIAAEGSFRGIGLHKSRTLFGEEIQELLKQLNDSYSWLVAFHEAPSDSSERKKWAENWHKHITFLLDTTRQLPEVFKPYIYFGDYKKCPWYIFWK